MKAKKYDISKNLSSHVSDFKMQYFITTKTLDERYIDALKESTKLTDELLAEWLEVNIKTFRSYKKDEDKLKDYLKERIILLTSLFLHGQLVFGNNSNFMEWLNSENFYLDNEKPVRFMKTVTGLRLIDDRLTSLEFGDNV